jgi:hypothetical protein
MLCVEGYSRGGVSVPERRIEFSHEFLHEHRADFV